MRETNTLKVREREREIQRKEGKRQSERKRE